MTRQKPRHAPRRGADKPADKRADLIPLDEFDTGDDLLTELESEEDAAVVIFKDENGEAANCFTVGPADLSWPQLLDKIRLEYGPGKYWARGRVGSQWRGRKKILIAAVRNALTPLAAAPAAAPAAPQHDAGTKMVLDMLTKQTEQQTELLKAVLTKGGGGTGIELKDAIALAQLFRGETKDPIETLAKSAEFFKQMGMGGGGDHETNMADVVGKLIDNLPHLAALGASSSATPSAPVPAAVTHKPAAPAAVAGGGKPAQPNMANTVKLLLNAARKDSDPAAYAVVAIDIAGEAAVKMLLAQPQPMALLQSVAPEVAQHAEWFAEFIDAAREILAAAEAEAEPGAPAPAPASEGAPAST